MKRDKKEEMEAKAKGDPALPPDYQTRDKGDEMERENEESLHNAYRNRKRVVTDSPTKQTNKTKQDTKRK